MKKLIFAAAILAIAANASAASLHGLAWAGVKQATHPMADAKAAAKGAKASVKAAVKAAVWGVKHL